MSPLINAKKRPLVITFINLVFVILVLYLIKQFYLLKPLTVTKIEDVQYRLLVIDERINYRLNLLVKNLSKETKTFKSREGRFFEMEVYSGDKPIWTWSKNKFFLARNAAFSLKPKESKEFNINWNKFNDWGKRVKAGEEIIIVCRLLFLESEPALAVKLKTKEIGK